MVAELIDKYIWLIQTFINAGDKGLSLYELEERWTRRYDEPYPRRTFNNHREAIDEIFGIEISCNRSTNRYYISYGEDVTDQDSSRRWLINTFTVNNLLSLGKERLSGRVSVEDIPSGQTHLTSIMEAMNDNRVLAMSYRKYISDTSEDLDIYPYAVKEMQKRWYLVGWCEQRKALRVYGLDRIQEIRLTDRHFLLPRGFDVDELFAESFGMYLSEGRKAETVEFSASEEQARYLRDLPLHSSQREIPSELGRVTFRMRVVPDNALLLELTKLGDRIEVISPAHLREAVIKEHKKALELYE